MLSLLQILDILYTKLDLKFYSFLTVATNFEHQLIIFKSLKGFSILTFSVFQKALNKHYLKHINVFKSFFDSLIYGTCFYFKKLIRIKGVGSRFELKKTKTTQQIYLKLKAGYHKPIIFRFRPKFFKLRVPKNTRMIVQCTEWPNIHKLLHSVQRHRLPNVYTGKGMYFRYQRIVRKAVNKKK